MKEPGVKSPAFLQLRRLRGKRQDPVELTNGVANSAREQASTTRATAKDLRTQQAQQGDWTGMGDLNYCAWVEIVVGLLNSLAK